MNVSICSQGSDVERLPDSPTSTHETRPEGVVEGGTETVSRGPVSWVSTGCVTVPIEPYFRYQRLTARSSFLTLCFRLHSKLYVRPSTLTTRVSFSPLRLLVTKFVRFICWRLVPVNEGVTETFVWSKMDRLWGVYQTKLYPNRTLWIQKEKR